MTVSPPPRWALIGFAATVVLGVAILWFNPAAIDSAFGSMLLLQMFAASSGFSTAACRGFFDPLLTGEHSRQRVAMASLAAAAWPGLLAWFLLVVIAIGFGQPRVAVDGHRHVAIAVVSVFAWAGGLALPRVAAGGIWAFLLVGSALFRGMLVRYLAIVQSPPTSLLDVCQSIAAFAFCPFLLLDDTPAAMNRIVIGADGIVLLAVIWCAVRYVERRDYALMDPA